MVRSGHDRHDDTRGQSFSEPKMLDTESVAATQGQVSQKGTGAMARNNFTVLCGGLSGP